MCVLLVCVISVFYSYICFRKKQVLTDWKKFPPRQKNLNRNDTLTGWVLSMMLNGTFNNISAISWWLVLLVEETGVHGENHWPVASHWQTLSHNVVSDTLTEISIIVFIINNVISLVIYKIEWYHNRIDMIWKWVWQMIIIGISLTIHSLAIITFFA